MTEKAIVLKIIDMMKPFGFIMRDTYGIDDGVRLRYMDNIELRWEWRNSHDFLFLRQPFSSLFNYQNDCDLHWMSDSFFDWLQRIHYILATANTTLPPIPPVFAEPGNSFHKSIGRFLTAYPGLLSCAGCSSVEELRLKFAVIGVDI